MEKINSWLVNRHLNYVSVFHTYTQLEKDKIGYAIRLILADTEKLIIIGIFFGIMGKLPEFLLCAAVLGLTRVYLGGIHMKTFWGCLSYSFIYFLILIYLLDGYIALSRLVCMIVYILNILLVSWIAPVETKQRFLYSKAQRMKIKYKSVAVVVGCSVFGVVFSKWSQLVAWIFILQIIEILGNKLYTSIQVSKRKGGNLYE